MLQTVDTRTETGDGTRIGALWAAVLLGPFAFMGALEVGYILVERACATGRILPVHLSFLALLGLLISAFAALLIVAQWSANLFRHPCQ